MADERRGVGAYVPWVIIALLFIFFLGPQILAFISLIFGGSAGTVTLQVQTDDSIGEVVFTPAGASMKVWDKETGLYLGTMTEDSSHDGKWDGSFPVLVDTWVIIKTADSGNTYYTSVVEREVQAPAAGVDRISILKPILMNPRSAASADDMVGTIMTGGVEVDNSTGIVAGESQLEFSFTAASGKTWGGVPYTDPENGDVYVGAFLVFDLTTTTARMTITGADYQFTFGAHTYWVFLLDPIINDADVDDDGTLHKTITVNNLAAATDCLSLHLGTNVIKIDMLSSSFGTNDVATAQDEAWLLIHLNA